MITVIRTATAFPGMTGEAIAWAKEVAALVKRVTGKEQFVCTSFGGMLADIAWIELISFQTNGSATGLISEIPQQRRRLFESPT
jgi:hypothetical protein